MVWTQSANVKRAQAGGPLNGFIIEPVDATNHAQGYKLYVNRGFQNPYIGVNKTNFFSYTYVIIGNNQARIKAKMNKYAWHFEP